MASVLGGGCGPIEPEESEAGAPAPLRALNHPERDPELLLRTPLDSKPLWLSAEPIDPAKLLSSEQLAALRDLQEKSKELTYEVWPRARTISRLDLNLPSVQKMDPRERAAAFVNRYGVLWDLSSLKGLITLPMRSQKACDSVTFQLTGSSSAPVVNAMLTVSITQDGNIRRVFGRMAGARVGLYPKERPDLDRARAAVQVSLPEGITLPPGELVWLDPFFLRDGQRAPRPAVLFEASPEAPDPAPPLLVDEMGTVTQASEPWSGVVDDAGCPLDPPWLAFPAVTVDPMTQTPTFVGLRAVGGVSTSGATNLQRAYDALGRNPLRQMFGSLDPAHHLTLIRERTNARGEAQISLQQVHAGIPVEGAALAVTLGPTGRAVEVAGRFVFRPTAAQSPRVSRATALKQALPEMLLACGGDRCAQALDPPSVSLVVLSSEIFPGTALPPKTARLAWRILYAGRQAYWDAEGSLGSLFTFSADREFLYTIANLAANSAVEIVDGVPVPGVTPSTEALAAAGILDPDKTNPIESFYAARGWLSFDNAGGRLLLSVNGSRLSTAAWRPADSSAGTPSRMFLNARWALPDVVAHEFAHGVAEFSAGLANVGEPGGLGESYSDVLASAIFPDTPAGTTWQMGEASPLGRIRDLRSPELRCTNTNLPDCVAHPRHYAQVPDNCGSAQDPEPCAVHALSAIPSLAAVFMAEGGNPGSTAPIGRAKLAELTFRALTGGRLFAGARFLQHTSVMVTTCHDLASVQAAGFTFADCDHVERALFDVGLSNNITYGWLRFGNSPTGFRSNEDRFAGQRLFRGCTIASHELVATDSNGTSQRVTGSTAADLALDMGDWGTYVDHRGADTDPTDRHVNLRVWSRWYLSAQVDIAENLDVPSGVARREDCYIPPPQNPQSPPSHLRVLYSTTRISHWATFLNGERFDEYVNATLSPIGGGPGYVAVPVYMPAGCEIIDISGIDYHAGVPQGNPSSGAVHGGHNFSVSRVYTHPASLAAFVHTWHDGASAVAVRVVYTVAEENGVDCSVPGATQDTP